MNEDNLYIVIPAYNEEENIENVVKEWHRVVKKIGNKSKLIVINDGSSDNTLNILTNLKNQYKFLEVLTKENGGHGDTLLYGYKYTLDKKVSYIFQTDSDGQTLSKEFWDFWKERKKYNAIIGKRTKRQDGTSRIFVTRVLKLVLLIIFHLHVEDANTPYRLIERKTLAKYYNDIPEHFNLSNVILTVLMLHNNENVIFKEITFRPRQGGINSINMKKIFKIGIQALKDFRKIKKTLKKYH